MVEKIIRCPSCSHQVLVHGKPHEKILLTCPKCHTQGLYTFPDTTPSPEQKEEQNIQRPGGVVLLVFFAITGIIQGIVSVVFMILFLVSNPEMSSSSVSSAFFNFLLGIVILIFSTLIAYGFWKGLRWSWFVAIFFYILLSIILVGRMISPFFMTMGNSFLDSFGLYWSIAIFNSIVYIVFSGLIIYYLTRPKVKTYFHVSKSSDIGRDHP